MNFCVDFSIGIDKIVSREYILKYLGRFINTGEDKCLFLLGFNFGLIGSSAIGVGSVEIIIFLIAVGEEVKLLLLGDLGCLEEDFFG